MGERDIHYKFADFAVYPSRLCFFIAIMIANINNFGVINFYENNASKQESKQKAEPVCEDITPVQEKPDKKGLFCRITKAAYEKGVAQQVEDDLCSACVSAPKLVKALNTNDALGYTDTKNLYSSELYDLLDEHYGLPFKKHQFTVCRSK